MPLLERRDAHIIRTLVLRKMAVLYFVLSARMLLCMNRDACRSFGGLQTLTSFQQEGRLKNR